jgi:hypothetical protein
MTVSHSPFCAVSTSVRKNLTVQGAGTGLESSFRNDFFVAAFMPGPALTGENHEDDHAP